MSIFLMLVFLSYLLLCKFAKAGGLFNVLVVIFIILSTALRFNVEIKDNLDYEGYILWDNSPIKLSLLTIFAEPYFYVLSNVFYKFTKSSAEALYYIYHVNFIISTYFFIWLASKIDILLWKKMLLFTFYYFLFTYTTLRNGPAYILVAYMFYAIQRNRKYLAGYLSFLAHASALPALMATFLKFKKPTTKVLILIVMLSVLLATVMQLPAFSHVSNKYDAYTDSDMKRDVTLFHKIYFGVMILLNIYLFMYRRIYVFTNIYIFMIMLYVWMYFQNPVMAFRFSVFIVTFLCLHPQDQKIKRFDIFLNAISSIFVIGFLYTFYSNHK